MAKKELNLFAIDGDERKLLSTAEELGFSALRTVREARAEAELVAPSRFVFAEGELFVHLVPPGVALADVPFMAVRDGGARVRPDAPAIELMRTFRRGNELHHGSLYTHPAKGDRHEAVARKSFDRLKRATNDWETTTTLACRVGPDAAALHRGGVRLMSAAVELTLKER